MRIILKNVCSEAPVLLQSSPVVHEQQRRRGRTSFPDANLAADPSENPAESLKGGGTLWRKAGGAADT